MRRALFSTLATALLVSLPSAGADPDPVGPKSQELVLIKTVHQAQTLPAEVSAVEIRFYNLVDKDEAGITAILEALAKHGGIKALKLGMPNSKQITKSHLDLLKEIKSLERLELIDQRDFMSPEVFEQVAAIKGLRHLTMSFG
ncbi:MAG: hypothetical protein VCA34_12795 [Roseibacillus sp.]